MRERESERERERKQERETEGGNASARVPVTSQPQNLKPLYRFTRVSFQIYQGFIGFVRFYYGFPQVVLQVRVVYRAQTRPRPGYPSTPTRDESSLSLFVTLEPEVE